MSKEDADPKRYLYSTSDGLDREGVGFRVKGEEGATSCGSVSQQMHRMASGYGVGGCGSVGAGGGGAELQHEPLGLASDGSDSSHGRPASPGSPRDSRKRPRPTMHEDVEMGGSESGTESHGNESQGNESQGNESHHGNESVGSSSNGNGKDSALLESSVSNKSSNSHSPSPLSSSNAFSLVSSEQDNPSSSGCSSEQSAKAKTRKELAKTIKELKKHLPREKRNKGKPSTLNTLKYALRCVKQVKANEEHYQMLMTNDSHPPGLDVSSYTIEEINRITSEYTLKSTDIFAVAVSLITGKIIYISDQASSILNCKRKVFDNAKFVEFLAPQDVSVFYSFTTPYCLPSWSMCTGAESSPNECMQERSFFCRISGGKEHEGDLQYYPFRMTPYLMKVQDPQLSQEQLCCLLLAERVHSGYEAPRIPSDKRIFTTTHTPNCVFQDVDERAVPLLGYLPQDLIGTPLLLNLHPSDRPIMLAVHRKIVQYAGQPFDHSSIRFRAKNGEYVTIDTSWSSFVNPWSRKVSFVIGRHKVRTGPVNEAVFAAPAFHGGKLMDSDIQEISEQIHRLLLQPVHSMGSSGYGSNSSHEQLISAVSSSESTANVAMEETEGKVKPPRSFQEICKGVHMLKNQQDPQVYLASASPLTPKLELRKSSGAAVQKSPVVCLKHSEPPLLAKDSTTASMADLTCKDQTVYSYQQINCLDSVIRYLESYNVPITVKRKCSTSDTDMQESQDPLTLDSQHGLSDMKAPKTPPSGAAAVVGSPSLTPLPLLSKSESVVSITSQCSYRSTIVHVGDKKPLPESEIIEDVAESPPVVVSSSPSQEKEAYKRLDLTKQVLAAHTQKEEQAFLHSCRDLRSARTFQKDCSTYLHKHRELTRFQESPGVQGSSKPGACRSEPAAKKGSRNRKSKKPRLKQPDSSDSGASDRKPRLPLQGLNQTSWSPSEASQSAFSVSYRAMVPAAYQLPAYPTPPAPPALAPCPDPSLSTGYGEGQSGHAPPTATPYPTPMVTPVVALVLPNYLFPPIGQLGQMDPMGTAPSRAFFPEQTQTQTAYTTHEQPFHTPQPAYTIQTQASFNSQQPFPAQPAYTTAQPFQALPAVYTTPQPFQAPPAVYTTPQPFQAPLTAQPFQAPPAVYTTAQPFQAPPAVYTTPQPFQAPLTPQPFQAPQAVYTTPQPFQAPLTPQPFQAPQAVYTTLPSLPVQAPFVSQASYPDQPCSSYGPTPEPSKSLATEPREGAASRSSTPASAAGHEVPSSPSLFESRCSTPLQLNLLSMEETQGSAERQNNTGPSAGAEDGCTAGAVGQQGGAVGVKTGIPQMTSPVHRAHSDSNSSLTDLEVLLQEDTGSATSGSLGSTSESNGLGTSASGASGSHTGSSSNTSKYFGSEDSLEHDPKTTAMGPTRGQSHSQSQVSNGLGEVEHFVKCVPQESPWLLMANADDNVMMTYEMPSRDIQRVLREDKERLRQMQKSQPRFSSDQRRELMAEHPWVRRGGLPSAINVKECVYCEEAASEPVQEDLPDMDLGDMGGESSQEGQCPQGQTEESPLETDYGC